MRTLNSAAPSRRSTTLHEVRASRPRGARTDMRRRCTGSRPIGRADLATRPAGHAVDERQVLLLDRAARELQRERAMGLVALGHHQQAGRALVEPVNDAGAQHAADPGQVRHAGEQRVHQGAARRASAGVDDETGRLVEDQQRPVLVHDAQRDVLGLRLGRRRRRHARRAQPVPRARAWRPAPGPSRGARGRPRSAPGAASARGPAAAGRARRRAAGRPRPGRRPASGSRPPQAAAGARVCVRFTRGRIRAAPSSITTEMSCDVETTPPNHAPRSGSPRQNSRAKRMAE